MGLNNSSNSTACDWGRNPHDQYAHVRWLGKGIVVGDGKWKEETDLGMIRLWMPSSTKRDMPSSRLRRALDDLYSPPYSRTEAFSNPHFHIPWFYEYRIREWKNKDLSGGGTRQNWNRLGLLLGYLFPHFVLSPEIHFCDDMAEP